MPVPNASTPDAKSSLLTRCCPAQSVLLPTLQPPGPGGAAGDPPVTTYASRSEPGPGFHPPKSRAPVGHRRILRRMMVAPHPPRTAPTQLTGTGVGTGIGGLPGASQSGCLAQQPTATPTPSPGKRDMARLGQPASLEAACCTPCAHSSLGADRLGGTPQSDPQGSAVSSSPWTHRSDLALQGSEWGQAWRPTGLARDAPEDRWDRVKGEHR